MSGLSVTFDEERELTVTVESDGSESNPVTYCQTVSPPHGDIVRALFELPALFADEPAWWLRVGAWQVRMETRPRDRSSVHVELVGTFKPKMKATTIVSKETVCAELLSAARSYRDWACKDDETANVSHCLGLSVGIDDATQRLRLHREDGSQDRYEPAVDAEQIETFARHADQCFHDPLGEYVLQTGALKPFVRDLTTRDDDDLASECYRSLLLYEAELARPTAEVLAEYPDERAREPLTGARWSFPDAEETMVAALERLPDE
ncbi:hypothetical protein EGH22_08820 [Halomicroarcula sp. F28]|uniref:hypothetical protein n=1 Tax=Haloarcula salinisoli TaxID=2487746 RepID=UPI001C738F7B|nr:hypothetical protein [Halomicroarcula salinisoli]MBX0286428.1 hypothetical protein [Halomicroarcula salinisoli]